MNFYTEQDELIRSHRGLRIDWGFLVPHTLYLDLLKFLPINGFQGEPSDDTIKSLIARLDESFRESNYPEDFVLIESLGFSNRLYNVLRRECFFTVGDILRGDRYKKWSKIYNLGKKGRAELEDKMHSLGYKNFSTSRHNNQLGKCFRDVRLSNETRSLLINKHYFSNEDNVNHLISLFYRCNIWGEPMMYYLSNEQREEIQNALEDGCFVNEITRVQHNITE